MGLTQNKSNSFISPCTQKHRLNSRDLRIHCCRTARRSMHQTQEKAPSRQSDQIRSCSFLYLKASLKRCSDLDSRILVFLPLAQSQIPVVCVASCLFPGAG
ncbi:hypothetical protein BDA96_08G184300 [Sorghum bicolor]|uniref:Uncharacterized protein n=2 Tax=Sorghum bicolor TaxID=4558 RepID=A0A921U7Z9_SORBI|nr:hypothetical protein BDA96_08G184300 [Sorghum bicolor]KXG23978.1 hypothetical protein SORBI_3008G166800 [Sorghum bicolor]